MTTFHVNPFVLRQTKDSEFSYFAGNSDELLLRVQQSFAEGRITPGYRDGVALVSVDPEGFFSSMTVLKEGDKLTGEFKPRRKGESPRKSVYAAADKVPAKSVQIVLYRHDVLAENNEHSSEADWEVISINASLTVDGNDPMPPGTLMANHFQVSGGTATNMTDSEFVAALRESFLFWQDKAFSKPA